MSTCRCRRATHQRRRRRRRGTQCGAVNFLQVQAREEEEEKKKKERLHSSTVCSTTKPEDLYRIIEHFSLGRRRLELFGEDHNIRAGWLTIGKGLSSSNFNKEAYGKNFADKDGKVWQGGGGRNPPPDAPHLVLTTPDIESLRPKSPPQKNQQQQSAALCTTANSSKRQTGNSPQNPTASSVHGLNQEASGSNPPTPVPWASPMGSFKGAEGGNVGPEDKFFDGYVFNTSLQPSGDHIEFDPPGPLNLM